MHLIVGEPPSITVMHAYTGHAKLYFDGDSVCRRLIRVQVSDSSGGSSSNFTATWALTTGSEHHAAPTSDSRRRDGF